MMRAIKKPEWLFVILAAVYGSLLAVILPPGQVPDEYQHFGRAYMLSEGQIFPTVASLPRGIALMLAMTAKLPFHIEEKITFIELLRVGNQPIQVETRLPKPLPASSVFSPIPYSLTALGIFLGRALGFPALALFSLGRLFALIAWIGLGFMTVRLTPIFKWVFFLLLLSPMALHQAASYSADSLTNALSFLWLSICLRQALGERLITRGSLFLLLLLAIFLPLTKPPYALLLGTAVIIPTAKYPNWRIGGLFIKPGEVRAITLGSLLLLGATLFFATANINREYYAAMLPITGIDSQAQIGHILHHPIEFLGVLSQTLLQDGLLIFQGYIGIFGWLDTRLPVFVYWLQPLAILTVAVLDSRLQPILLGWQKLVLGLTGLATFIGVAAGLYATWTPVAAPKVSDIQGRYLIPIVPYLLLLTYNQRLSAYRRLLGIAVPIYVSFILITTIWTIVVRYYLLAIRI